MPSEKRRTVLIAIIALLAVVGLAILLSRPISQTVAGPYRHLGGADDAAEAARIGRLIDRAWNPAG